MKTRFAWTLFAATLAALLWYGCDDETEQVKPILPEERIASIELGWGLTQDTLYFIPSDSAYVTSWARAVDESGLPVAGAAISITVSDPSLGGIQFLDDDLQNVTNAEGRVEYRYQSYARDGTQTIYACANSICDHFTFYSEQLRGGPYPLSLIVTPFRVEADSNEFVQCFVQATIVDHSNRGIPGVTFQVSTTGGYLTQPIPPTDSTGQSAFLWTFYNEFGDFTIRVRAGTLVDSATFRIDYREPPLTLELTSNLPGDTLRPFGSRGDTVQAGATLTAVLRNPQGVPIANAPINMWVADPALGHIEFSDLHTGNRTDSEGRVSAAYRSSSYVGAQLITCMYQDVQTQLVLTSVSVRFALFSTLTMTSTPQWQDTFYVRPGEDFEIEISTRWFDANGNPEQGVDRISIASGVTGGFMLPFTPIANGTAEASWIFYDAFGTSFGTYQLTVLEFEPVQVTILADTTS